MQGFIAFSLLKLIKLVKKFIIIIIKISQKEILLKLIQKRYLISIFCWVDFLANLFSISGRKKGFEDTRVNTFFDICRIIEEKEPKIVVLENKTSHSSLIKNELLKLFQVLNNLGYNVSYKILNARNFGLPQNRERIFIIATKMAFLILMN